MASSSSSSSSSAGKPRERHDPRDTEVSGDKWAVVADEGAGTAVFRHTVKNVIAMTLTRGQYEQVRKDLQNLQAYSELPEARERLGEVSFEDAEVNVVDIMSTKVEEAPRGRKKHMRVQCLAAVSFVFLFSTQNPLSKISYP